ncbi:MULTISPECIES: ABC transporter [unclassified Nocardiopsis]|uniref:ABC transporter n=1 Tax=unclassified Nocardiopsis TaxID=2649073 RepID=UPI0013575DBC|nr:MULTISPECIES: ABC transporter [unclassified Nocardiopsis]
MRSPRHAPPGALGLCAVLLAAGCATAPATEEGQEEEVPHGYVEGAEETAEPQARLVVADADSGEVRVLDPITGEVTDLEPVEGVDGIAGDGRFAYLRSSGHRKTLVVDSGVWTADHGDHDHYYRTGVRTVGAVDGLAAGRAATDRALTAPTGPGGTALLDRAALEDGSVQAADVPGGTGVIVPFAGRLVTAGSGPGRAVRVHDRDGGPGEALDATCAEPRGQAVTRRGLVIGCEDGALLVTEDDGDLTGEAIPYPEGTDGRVEEFHHRPGSAPLASVSTEGDVWLLDLAEGGWARLGLPGAVAVSAVGEGASVLALDSDGTLYALDPETGEPNSSRELLDGVDAERAPVIQVDTGRAYVNDAGAGLIHEIDYNDDLRVARTFDPGITPHHMVETGR